MILEELNIFGEEKEEYSFVGRAESRRVVQGGGTRGRKITLEPPAEKSKLGRVMPVNASACCCRRRAVFPARGRQPRVVPQSVFSHPVS